MVWLPTLERASTWNGWSGDELLLQLAGERIASLTTQDETIIYTAQKHTCMHMCMRRVHTELNMIQVHTGYAPQRVSPTGVESHEPGKQVDLPGRRISQGDVEKVADFIRRLEQTFKIAYG